MSERAKQGRSKAATWRAIAAGYSRIVSWQTKWTVGSLGELKPMAPYYHCRQCRYIDRRQHFGGGTAAGRSNPNPLDLIEAGGVTRTVVELRGPRRFMASDSHGMLQRTAIL